ncbi:hypothetical protein QWZ10_21015 [Paracoccus cavernae]|uniref:Uncharacterized protein n=1 Tax=Paracoccus cavernae TaxID=1571207 RepID=A0ABT8DE23_9RHOB|nr:hypothetical protein [Paracoccus cavernae]
MIGAATRENQHQPSSQDASMADRHGYSIDADTLCRFGLYRRAPFSAYRATGGSSTLPVAAAYRRINKGLLPDGVAPTIFRINTGDE